MTTRIDTLAALGLLALAIIWGGSFFFTEIAIRDMPPIVVSFHRVFWAVPVLFVVAKLAGHNIPLDAKTWGAFLVMAGLNNAIPFTLIIWGQTHIESGLASILNATTGIFGAVVAGALLRDEPLLPRKILGAVIGIAGVAIVIGPALLSQLDFRNLAQLAILGAALSYSFASVWGRKTLGQNPPLVNAFGMVSGSSVIMGVVVLAQYGRFDLSFAMASWASVAALSVICTSLAYILYFAILKRAGAANLMLVTLLIPPFAIALGAGFLGESLSPQVYLGMAVICLGMLITDGRLAARLIKR